MITKLTPEQIARICHEANRALCEVLGDDSQRHWDQAPEWQRDSALAGVSAVIADPRLLPIDLHERWSEHKRADGWVYGPVKDAANKTHPCLVPYHQLPEEQRYKDVLFGSIVRALAVDEYGRTNVDQAMISPGVENRPGWGD